MRNKSKVDFRKERNEVRKVVIHNLILDIYLHGPDPNYGYGLDFFIPFLSCLLLEVS